MKILLDLQAEKVTLESHCHEVDKALDEATQAKDDLVAEFDAQKLSHENALLSLREEINLANQTLDEEKNRYMCRCYMVIDCFLTTMFFMMVILLSSPLLLF